MTASPSQQDAEMSGTQHTLSPGSLLEGHGESSQWQFRPPYQRADNETGSSASRAGQSHAFAFYRVHGSEVGNMVFRQGSCLSSRETGPGPPLTRPGDRAWPITGTRGQGQDKLILPFPVPLGPLFP